MRGLRQVLAAIVAASLAAACSDGPVSDGPAEAVVTLEDASPQEGAYIEVERAYSNSGIEPGSELMIEITGRYMERPAMEGNHSELNLIVDSFKNLLPDKTCVLVAFHS